MNQQNAFLVTVAGAIALALGIWFAVSKQGSDDRLAPVTTLHFSDFALPDNQGRSQRLSSWRGKVILLNFWATWCPPCLEEMPLFNRLQNQHRDTGLQIIGVAIDNAKNVKDFLEVMPVNYPILLDTGDGMAIMKRYGNRYGNLPYSVVFNRDGNVLHNKIGAFTAAELDKLLLPMLKTVATPKPQ